MEQTRWCGLIGSNGQTTDRGDDRPAEIIPLRRSALGPTADRLQRLALDAGLTLTELVATADTHGVELPPAIRRAAAAMLRAPLADPVEEGLRYRASMPATIDTVAALGTADLARQEGLVQAPFSAKALIAPSRDWLVDHGADQAAGPESSRVGMAEAEAIRDTFSAFQELDTKYGGAHARTALIQYLNSDVVPLLEKSCTDSDSRAVFGAAAELTYLAGLTAFDSGQHGLAERYFVQALRLASEAEEHAFAGNILAAMSHMAASHGDGHEAVQLAKAGLCGAKSAGVHSVEMRLNAMLARGHALLREPDKCAVALSKAEVALDKAKPGCELSWCRFLDGAFLAGETAQCFLALGQPELAQRFAVESVKSNSQRTRRLALSQVVLATSYVQMDEPEAGCSEGKQALNLIVRIKSSRSLMTLRDFAASLYHYQAISAVQEFDQLAAELLGDATWSRIRPRQLNDRR
jgi:hypothetical protein